MSTDIIIIIIIKKIQRAYCNKKVSAT